MSKGHTYTVLEGRSLFSGRKVVLYPGSAKSATSKKHLVIPFSGFDGQHLAGKGALVFEGEVLSSQARI